MNLLFLDMVNVYVSAHVCVSGLSLQHSTHSQNTLNLELVRITHAFTHTHGVCGEWLLLSAQGCMSVSISVNAKRNCNCISPQCAHTVYTETHATNTHSAREDMTVHISIKDSAFFSWRAQYSYLGKAFAMLTIHKTDKHTHMPAHTPLLTETL